MYVYILGKKITITVPLQNHIQWRMERTKSQQRNQIYFPIPTLKALDFITFIYAVAVSVYNFTLKEQKFTFSKSIIFFCMYVYTYLVLEHTRSNANNDTLTGTGNTFQILLLY